MGFQQDLNTHDPFGLRQVEDAQPGLGKDTTRYEHSLSVISGTFAKGASLALDSPS